MKTVFDWVTLHELILFSIYYFHLFQTNDVKRTILLCGMREDVELFVLTGNVINRTFPFLQEWKM